MIVLVLGGARSGKSDLAERWAARRAAPVTYVATGWAGDEDMAARIEAHRRRRPAGWTTIETGGPGLAAVLRGVEGTVLLDALGTWLAAHQDFAVDAGELCAALCSRSGDTIVVSDEVGLSVHPETELGVRFRDALGSLNQAVAAVADRSVLVVAGRALEVRPWDDLLP
ncbi:MAG: bifunctional adenosylcobinamide kinase/adenosylcobinamide-phosphate guanylyltransferase [Acidimicrobiales bacterium]|nr:bifunctional adenosylcobinamide kinase/adenosylcobinamide-phosphate guanylyltransferase [Acidimicrobiales bacterium]